MLADSKKLSEKKRTLLKPILENVSLSYSVKHIFEEEIDEINILNASILAMHESLNHLTLRPQVILVDGNRFKPYSDIKYHCIVKGDNKYFSIAAASVLAKTYRDAYM